MLSREKLIEAVYNLFDDPSHKDELILQLFQYQIKNNPILLSFVDSINATKCPTSLDELTYLPISFFKTHQVMTNEWEPVQVFTSSGTTGNQTSKHKIREHAIYQKVSKSIFEKKYGPLKNKIVIGLLPSYLERSDSSLVYMVNYFMEQTNEPGAFYLNNFEELNVRLKELENREIEIILFGVSFALLDFAKNFKTENTNLKIIETGGMKGRAKELIRSELHAEIQRGFPNAEIHSEYGMTELLSQAYANGNLFEQAHSMYITCREISDPFTEVKKGKTGIINIVDLANVDSVAFIATEDLGRVHKNGSFEVLGRADNSLARGCNLLYV